MTKAEEAIKRLRMTNDRAIERLRMLWNIIGLDNKYLNKAFTMAFEALEKAEKYRWHDLRKNPDDLPEDALSSVIAWDKNMMICVFAQYTGNEWVLRGNGGIYFPEVIAWREIELFEEVKE